MIEFSGVPLCRLLAAGDSQGQDGTIFEGVLNKLVESTLANSLVDFGVSVFFLLFCFLGVIIKSASDMPTDCLSVFSSFSTAIFDNEIGAGPFPPVVDIAGDCGVNVPLIGVVSTDGIGVVDDFLICTERMG